LDVGYLKRYPGFAAWHKGDVVEDQQVSSTPSLAGTQQPETPEEALERIWGAIRGQVANELLESVKAGTSQFFERASCSSSWRWGMGVATPKEPWAETYSQRLFAEAVPAR
jgi:restriction endonuclease Mrr